MKIHLNLFTKTLLLIIMLLTPMLILYSFSNKTSVEVISDELQKSNFQRLSFFLDQVDSEVDNLNGVINTLSRDPSIQSIPVFPLDSDFDQVKISLTVDEKLRLQGVSSKWPVIITVISPSANKAFSSNGILSYDKSLIPEFMGYNWTYGLTPWHGDEKPRFSKLIVEPVNTLNNLSSANLILEICFSPDNLRSLLQSYKSSSKGDTFFYTPGFDAIRRTDNSQNSATDEIMKHLNFSKGSIKNKIIRLENESYLVNVLKSQRLGLYLVDYVPLKDILSPINKSNTLFYSSVLLLIVLSIIAAMFLYLNVQKPINALVRGVQKLKAGEYSFRIKNNRSNEFTFLILSFNEMAEEIQELIEKVYQEKILSREAKLKQLQSQINPHFLYNCLFFIMNMASLGDEDAIVAMSLNLGEYFRYTTRIDNPNAALKEEIKLVNNYLTIQQLRMKRLSFEINIPESMEDLRIPRLLLQPIIENSVIHGIEQKMGPGKITVTGVQTESENRIVVEDDGIGMSPEVLQELNRKLNSPITDDMGYGIWNIHQRLIYLFGEGSGLDIDSALNKGTRFIIHWNKNIQLD